MNLLPAVLEAAGDAARMRLAQMTLDLPRRPLAALAPHLGKEITFGIRPEDLYEDAPASMPRLSVEVRGVEPLGAETILLLSAGGHDVVARVGRETSFHIGERREIALDLGAVHLFDAANGEAIHPPA
jgi:multiple sugar transport system ATP-binding protein